MQEETLKELRVWLSKCNGIPPKRTRQRTFMDIVGINHRENSWSDIYAYFFNPKEKHKLGRLFIDTLNNLISGTLELKDFTVTREKVIDDKKRIDLLIRNEDEALIIENKVYASLYNDLSLYWKNVKAAYKKGVVLSLYEIRIPKENMGNFVNITHKKFADAIMEAIPKCSRTADSKSLFLLQEFIQNIYNETYTMNEEELKFYYQNDDDRERINRLSDIRSNVINYIRDSVEGKGKNSEDEKYINYLLEGIKIPISEKGNIKLSVKAQKNNSFTYYCYNKYPEQITLTLEYDSLWNYKANGCRIKLYLDVKGNILKFIESNTILLKENGIEADPQSTFQNGWWHFQKDEIQFKPEDLLNPYNIRKRIIEDIKDSALYNNGAKIIECFRQKRE